MIDVRDGKAATKFLGDAIAAIEAMEAGLYVVPFDMPEGRRWQVRVPSGADMPLSYIVNHETRGLFACPFSALREAHAWLREHARGLLS